MRSDAEAPNLPPRLIVVRSATPSQASGFVRFMLGTDVEPGCLNFGLDVPSAHAFQEAIARSALAEGHGAALADVLEAFEVDDGSTAAQSLRPGAAPFAVAFGAAPFVAADDARTPGVVAYIQAPGERAVAWVVREPRALSVQILRAASLVQYAEDNPNDPVPSP